MHAVPSENKGEDFLDDYCGENHKEIWNRFETPLQASIDIDVINLAIVLQQSGKKQIFSKSQIESGSD